MAFHQNYETYRCELFENISVTVWEKIVRAHKVGVDLDERGITKDIIVDILTFNQNAYRNFKVYAKSSYLEKVYGADMDVYIEIRNGLYHWYALQAKILKTNGRYISLRDGSDDRMQWDKLHTLEALVGCRAYYLLYNGVEDYKHKGHDQCENEFDEKQYGCSLVELGPIKRLATTRSVRTGRYVNPTFEDIHPEHAQPWRVLTCCRHGLYSLPTYSRAEVKGAVKSYVEVGDGQNSNDFNDNLDFISADNNRILTASRKADWQPAIKMVINNTSSIWKYDQL